MTVTSVAKGRVIFGEEWGNKADTSRSTPSTLLELQLVGIFNKVGFGLICYCYERHGFRVV